MHLALLWLVMTFDVFLPTHLSKLNKNQLICLGFKEKLRV
jgi:hypothetical protein